MASLHIDKEFDDLLNQLKNRLGMDKKQIVQKSIFYIFKNKINPDNIKEGDTSAELKALRKDLVGFIKTQEKEILEPMSQKVNFVAEKINKNQSLSNSTSNPTAEQFSSLLDSYKKLSANHSKLVEHYNNSNLVISKKHDLLTSEIKKLNETVESKLAKKIL